MTASKADRRISELEGVLNRMKGEVVQAREERSLMVSEAKEALREELG